MKELSKIHSKDFNKALLKYNFVATPPKKHTVIKSKYPSTMSDNIFEHILVKIGIIK
jgi:hypothetical protein